MIWRYSTLAQLIIFGSKVLLKKCNYNNWLNLKITSLFLTEFFPFLIFLNTDFLNEVIFDHNLTLICGYGSIE